MRTVIDIGTNSTLLLTGRLNDNRHVESLLQRFNVTRLGEGVHQTGVLGPAAMERTMNVLEKYKQEITSLGSMPVHLIGTQALRAATNAHEFTDKVKKNLDWEIRIISGDQEAEYTFIGAMDFDQNIRESLVVMDLGGGSTEIIFGEGDRILGHTSLPLGVVRAAEKLNMKENLTRNDCDQIFTWARTIFETRAIPAQSAYMQIIGVGGTITTLAAVKEKMSQYNPEKVNGYVLSVHDLKSIFDFLNSLSLTERRSVPGLMSGREDVILYGTLIFLAYMDYMGFENVIASDRGLRFGVLKKAELQDFA